MMSRIYRYKTISLSAYRLITAGIPYSAENRITLCLHDSLQLVV
ncbi:hypothetical protein ACUXCC_002441 [Cytobacillus horneckiae]